VSVITTLTRFNARPDRVPQLIAWFTDLEAKGLQSARLHVLELDGPTKYIALTTDESVEAMWTAHEFESRPGATLRFDVFTDMVKLLLGDDEQTTCVWNACDSWTTPAVHGIGAQGERHLCTRVNKDGREYIDAPPGPFVRQLILASTPQEQDGCQGCRFLAMCKGSCPGTAIDGDWRKRTVDCEMWKRLFERMEVKLKAEGKEPLSLSPERATIEARLIEAWRAGAHLPIKHARLGVRVTLNPGRAGWHGDVPHGDWHGDHTDASRGRKAEEKK
jgi:uncharacterized protein